MSELSEFGKMVSQNFENSVFEKNDYEETTMYLLLTNLQKLPYEKELLEFYKKNPKSSLTQLCDKEVELLLRDYPDGYNSDDYE